MELIKVFTDNYESIYFDGVNMLEDESIDTNEMLRRLVGEIVESYKVYYVEPKVLEYKYASVFPHRLDEFEKDDLI